MDQVDDAGKQKRIVKFTSASLKETVYKKQTEKQKKSAAEQERKNQQIRVRIKFQLSLTKRRVKLFGLANERFREVDQVKFAYADMHIKMMLRSPVQRKYVIGINDQKNKYHQVWKEVFKLVNDENGELKLHENYLIVTYL